MLVLDSTKVEIAQASKGIKNMDLVSKTGLCVQTILRIKRGKPCKPETVHSIAKALNVDPAKLVKKE